PRRGAAGTPGPRPRQGGGERQRGEPEAGEEGAESYPFHQRLAAARAEAAGPQSVQADRPSGLNRAEERLTGRPEHEGPEGDEEGAQEVDGPPPVGVGVQD